MYLNDSDRLKHMLEAASEVRDFTNGKDRNDLDGNPMLFHALVRLLEIIGEASSHISSEFKNSHSNIQWIDIIGMRNRLIHGYFTVNPDMVWKTVIDDIPVLINQLEELIENEQ